MQPMSPTHVRASLRNADERARRTMQLPRDLQDLDWENRDVLAWRDPRARHRGYITRWHHDRPEGLLLRIGASSARPDRAVMCSLCRFTARFDEVVLLTAPRHGSAGLRGDAVGILACEDLGCHRKLRTPPASGPLELSADDVIAARIAGFEERVDAFFRAVLR